MARTISGTSPRTSGSPPVSRNLRKPSPAATRAMRTISSRRQMVRLGFPALVTFRHAIETALVAPVGDRDSQVINFASKRIHANSFQTAKKLEAALRLFSTVVVVPHSDPSISAQMRQAFADGRRKNFQAFPHRRRLARQIHDQTSRRACRPPRATKSPSALWRTTAPA